MKLHVLAGQFITTDADTFSAVNCTKLETKSSSKFMLLLQLNSLGAFLFHSPFQGISI